MYRFAKLCHLVGLTLFLGSVFGHIVAGALGGAPGSADYLYARQEISAATLYLTLPGLALAIVSGVALARLGRRSPLAERWLAVKAAMALAIVAIAGLLVVPAGSRMLAGAATFATADPAAATVQLLADKRIEDGAGAVNVLLALGVVALGVFKPSLAKLRRRA